MQFKQKIEKKRQPKQNLRTKKKKKIVPCKDLIHFWVRSQRQGRRYIVVKDSNEHPYLELYIYIYTPHKKLHTP